MKIWKRILARDMKGDKIDEERERESEEVMIFSTLEIL